MSFLFYTSASRAGKRSGWSSADVTGSGVGPAGVPDAAGPAGAGAAGTAGAEDSAGEGEAAGPERAARLGPRRRTLPSAPQAGRETGEWPLTISRTIQTEINIQLFISCQKQSG